MEKLTADEPVTVGDVTLFPISKTSSMRKGAFLFYTKAPEAVVIRAPWGTKALGPSGEELPLEKLLKEVPGLRERVG